MSKKIPNLVTKLELANYLGVSVQTISRYQRKGMPVAFKLGGRWPRYNLDLCLDWLKENSDKEAQANE